MTLRRSGAAGPVPVTAVIVASGMLPVPRWPMLVVLASLLISVSGSHSPVLPGLSLVPSLMFVDSLSMHAANHRSISLVPVPVPGQSLSDDESTEHQYADCNQCLSHNETSCWVVFRFWFLVSNPCANMTCIYNLLCVLYEKAFGQRAAKYSIPKKYNF